MNKEEKSNSLMQARVAGWTSNVGNGEHVDWCICWDV